MRGRVFVAAQFVLFVAVAVAPRLDHADWRLLVRGAGIALAVAGVALCIWCVRLLGPAMTVLPEPRPRVPLATAGPYAVVRHPIYVGVVAVCLGASLARSTWLGVVLTGVLALLFDLKARYEERLLGADEAYGAYAAATPKRFLPRIY